MTEKTPREEFWEARVRLFETGGPGGPRVDNYWCEDEEEEVFGVDICGNPNAAYVRADIADKHKAALEKALEALLCARGFAAGQPDRMMDEAIATAKDALG